MTTEPNFDHLAERLRERITEPRDDYERGYCENCQARLTQADIDADECSNCHASLTMDDEDLSGDFCDFVDDTPDRLWEYGESK